MSFRRGTSSEDVFSSASRELAALGDSEEAGLSGRECVLDELSLGTDSIAKS